MRGRPGLKIAHLNARSLTNKVNQLRLDLPRSDLDLLTISETWLTNSIENRLTTVPGYNFIRADRETVREDGTTKKGGGLGIYYKSKYEIDPNRYKHLNVARRELET